MALKSPRRGVQSIRRHYSAALGSFPSRSFYVDATLGNDANSGTYPDDAWQTIGRVNGDTFLPGDRIRFKRGEEWLSEATLLAPSSGQLGKEILFGAYGDGAAPQFRNVTIMTGWANYAGTTWQINEWFGSSQIFMDDVRLIEGADKDTLNDHEWIIEGAAPGILYVRDDSGDPDITGVVIEAARAWACIDSNDQSHLIFEDFKLMKCNGPSIDVNAAGTNIRIRRIESDRCINGVWARNGVTDISIDNCTGNCTHIIACDDSSITNCTLDSTGNRFDNDELIKVTVGARVLVEGNTVSNCWHRGIWLQASGDDCVVRNNTVHDVADDGVQNEGMGIDVDGFGTAGIGGVLVEENTVYNCFTKGILMENTDDDPVVRKNVVYGCGGAGISLIAYAALRGVNFGGRVYNNLVYECVKGWEIFDTAGWDVWHNTFADCTNTGGTIWPDVGHPEYMDDVSFKNNIVTCNAELLSFREDWDLFTDHDNNIYFGANNFTRFNPAGAMTLAQFQVETGQEANSDYDNPDFVNPGADNYHLLVGSPCIGAGVNVGITEDLDGVTRSDPPDIGALQYVP